MFSEAYREFKNRYPDKLTRKLKLENATNSEEFV
jgi:hypothetical protein